MQSIIFHKSYLMNDRWLGLADRNLRNVPRKGTNIDRYIFYTTKYINIIDICISHIYIYVIYICYIYVIYICYIYMLYIYMLYIYVIYMLYIYVIYML